MQTVKYERELAVKGSYDVKALQRILEGENVMIHFPDEYVPEDRTVVIHGKNAAEIDGGHF